MNSIFWSTILRDCSIVDSNIKIIRIVWGKLDHTNRPIFTRSYRENRHQLYKEAIIYMNEARKVYDRFIRHEEVI